MKRGARSFDESDVKIRPSRSTKPRSKDRPDYSKLPRALVIQVDRGRNICLTDTGLTVTAMKARELGKNSVVVGDRVALDGDTSGEVGTLARVVAVTPRKNSLTRTIDDIGAKERVIVANVDLMIIVVAAANPTPRTGLIDRALVVAYDQAITPILLITKCDLASADEIKELYAPLELEIFTTQKGGDNEAFKKRIAGKISVLIGHSGVGKSTFLNAIAGKDLRATGGVNDVTGRGRHTSSSATAFLLESEDLSKDSPENSPENSSGNIEDKTWLIDTPGLRSFGLRHIDATRVVTSFEELAPVIATCPKRCSHNEESCQLDKWVELHPESAVRVASLRRLLSSDLDSEFDY